MSRIIAKAISWQIVGLIAMTVIGYAFTGSIEAGGSLAIVSTMAGFLTYVIHEKIWNAIPERPTSLPAPEQS